MCVGGGRPVWRVGFSRAGASGLCEGNNFWCGIGSPRVHGALCVAWACAGHQCVVGAVVVGDANKVVGVDADMGEGEWCGPVLGGCRAFRGVS